jgi:ankyrin repeat protein
VDAYKVIYGLFNDKQETIAYLQRHPTALHVKTKLEETPLHYCVIENRVDLAMELIAIGADVNCVEFAGNSPLMHAIQLSYAEMIDLLILSGADFNIKNNCGETALSIARKRKNTRLFEYLMGKRDRDIQYYFDAVDAMDIVENPDDEFNKTLIASGLKNPFDA